MMDQLIERFSAQLVEAMEIGENAVVNEHEFPINKIYVAGLGGSGIGADFVKEFVKDACPVPYIVGKAYSIPSFIDKNTLAICSSYSGNTEETLEAFGQMLNTGAKIMVVSSGGKLIDLAKEHGLDYIQVPGDWPSPRACLGYSILQQLYILNKLGFINDRFKSEVKAAIDMVKYDMDGIQAAAAFNIQPVHLVGRGVNFGLFINTAIAVEHVGDVFHPAIGNPRRVRAADDIDVVAHRQILHGLAVAGCVLGQCFNGFLRVQLLIFNRQQLQGNQLRKHHEVALVVGNHIDKVFHQRHELGEGLHATLHILHRAHANSVGLATAIVLVVAGFGIAIDLGVVPHHMGTVAQ